VAFATAPALCPAVERAGIAVFRAGLDDRAAREVALRRHPEVAHVRPEQGWRRANALFAGVSAPAMVEDLLPIVDTWAPDVLVHETAEYGGPLVAALRGIPSVHHSWGPLRPPEMALDAGDLVAPLWRKWGLEPDRFANHFRHLYLDLCPAGFQAPHTHHRAVSELLRPVPYAGEADQAIPGWVAALAPPVVYLTLGTVFNRDLEVFKSVLAGLRGEDVRVVVTVGADNDPAALGPQPSGVQVERWVDHTWLLPRCDLVITHGGSGTTLAALAHGLPLLVLPQGADHFRNGERCVASGVGRCLGRSEVDASSVRREVGLLLGSPSYRERARGLQAEIERMPSPDDGVTLLEDLVREWPHRR